jgi:hypothetical protein
LTGHTFTDVHWADGTTTWIEAQKPDEKGIDAGVQLLMDGNHDGDITYTDGFNSNEPTDGNLNVRVYSSRDAADAAGDGNPGSPEEGV